VLSLLHLWFSGSHSGMAVGCSMTVSPLSSSSAVHRVRHHWNAAVAPLARCQLSCQLGANCHTTTPLRCQCRIGMLTYDKGHGTRSGGALARNLSVLARLLRPLTESGRAPTETSTGADRAARLRPPALRSTGCRRRAHDSVRPRQSVPFRSTML
jgi:hypothetical protein